MRQEGTAGGQMTAPYLSHRFSLPLASLPASASSSSSAGAAAAQTRGSGVPEPPFSLGISSLACWI